jgi:ABC-type oligopeptide transport system substrate-binding subunit
MKPTTRGWLRFVAVFAVLALVLVACGDGAEEDTTTTTAAPGETTTTAADGGDGDTTTTTEGMMGPEGVFSTYIVEPENLTPSTSNESEGIAVLRALFKGLVDYDVRTSEPRNQVAESIVSDDGGTNWTITLKDGWTFHNGEPVTAQNFVDTWNFTAYGPNGQQNNSFMAIFAGYDEVAPAEGDPTAETLSGLAVVDDLTFTAELATADPQFPIKLGYGAYYPLPQAFFDGGTTAEERVAAFNEAPIGNGPFMMDGVWERNVQIATKYYPDYAGDDFPKAAGIIFQIYADEATAYNDLLAGNLDVMDNIPSEQVPNAAADFGDAYQTSAQTSFTYLGFPSYLPELTPDIRRALSMAIDRDLIMETVLNGAFFPAKSVIPPSLPGYREYVCDNWEYKPDEAKALFDAAGGWTGPMTMWFNSGAGHDVWVEAVSNRWRETLGIEEFVFEQLPFAEYLPVIDAQEITGPFRLGWGMDYPSPQNFLEPLFASYNAAPVGSNNAIYNSAEFDAAVAAGNAAAVDGLDAAIPDYQRAEDILCEDVPAAPIYFRQNHFAHSGGVEGLYVDAQGDINYTEISVLP